MAKKPADDPIHAPALSVKVQHRLTQPFGRGSLRIRTKDPDLHVRIVNSEVSDDHLYTMGEKGWRYLEPAMLATSPKQLGFRISTDGKLVRGHREQEVLMYMTEAEYQAIAAAKTAANLRVLASSRRSKADMVTATAAAHGDEAASFIDRHTQAEIAEVRAPELLEE